jgi:hypothetical protein
MGSRNSNAYAKGKPGLSTKTNITVQVNKQKTIKLKNVSKKVKWKTSNKNIVKIVKVTGKYKNQIKIKALKVGSAKVYAKYKNKKYTVNIKVVVPKTNNQNSDKNNKGEQTNEWSLKSPNMFEIEPVHSTIGTTEDLSIYGYVPWPNSNQKYMYEYDESIGTLYKYDENNQKIIVEPKALVNGTTYKKEWSQGFNLTVPVKQVYGALEPGEYLYVKNIMGKDYNVDFTVSTDAVAGQVVYEHPAYDGSLGIHLYTVGDYDELIMYNNTPGIMEGYDYETDSWQEISIRQGYEYEYAVYSISPGQEAYLYIDLEETYGDNMMKSGYSQFRYKKTIAGVDIVVYFTPGLVF